ncbi:MAG: TlyA family RNA methyltransferase [Chloroflexia bacterium]
MKRLDLLLVERGLAESRARARWLVRQGGVRVSGRPCLQPGRRFPEDVPLEVVEPLPYVSRGGLKLARLLEAFRIPVEGRVALDVGASTGGFTDCLLQRGAARVYAVDVGRGQLHPRLRADPRVIPLEETDIRDLETLPGGEKPDLAVVDVSFISLRLVLPAVLRLLQPPAEIIALVKPQFELGPGAVTRRGMVRRPEEGERAVREMLSFAEGMGLHPGGVVPLPPDGERGNVEYGVYFRM